jgi:hypothetical protein
MMADRSSKNSIHRSGPAGAVYGLGVIGAAVYYISHATGFWMGAWGLVKAVLWPGFLIYELLSFLGM